MPITALAFLILFGLTAEDQSQPAAVEIMSRVAANQDREQQARNQFVYEQKVHRTMRRKDGKLLREEYRTYSVTPGAKGTERKLLTVKGRYWKHGRYLSFEGEPVPAEGLLNVVLDDDDDSTTRDGIDKDLFPLTSDEQKNYTFERIGERVANGRSVYQIRFRPADRHDYGWTGEAWIDKEEFQPVSVYTRLSRKLPLAVRTMLGVDVPGLGFGIQYKRVDKDLWFPASYGTEFAVHALFLLNRTFTESMENTNFRRANVESHIEFPDTATK
ncbi:MAG: hypothetical protein WA324_27450 [Bryobacteraceae bacterium]